MKSSIRVEPSDWNSFFVPGYCVRMGPLFKMSTVGPTGIIIAPSLNYTPGMFFSKLSFSAGGRAPSLSECSPQVSDFLEVLMAGSLKVY